MMIIASVWAWFTPTILFCVANLLIATLFLASKSNTKTTTNPSHNHNHDNYENTNQSQNHEENQSQNRNRNQNQNENQNQNQNQNYEYSFSPQLPIVSSFLDRAKSINISSIIPTIITKTIITNQENPQYTSLSRLSQSIFSACSYDTQPDSPRYPSSKKPNPTPSILGRLKSIDFSKIYGDSQMTTNSPGQLAQANSVKSKKIPATTLAKKKKTKVKLASVEIKKTRSEVKSVSSHEDNEVACLQRPETARARRDADDDAKAENFITKFREQLKVQRMDSLDRYNDMLRRP